MIHLHYMKKYFALAIIVLAVAGLWVFRERIFGMQQVPTNHTELRVAVTSVELAKIAEEIGGKEVTVQVVTEDNSQAVQHADVFIYIGNKSDVWAHALASGLAKQGIVPVKALSGPGTGLEQMTSETNRQLAIRLVNIYGVLDQPHASLYAAASEKYLARQ